MKHYTYAWLREDGTPYYIGKGQNRRAWSKQRRKNCARPPHDESRIIILKKFETNEEALLHERYMIYIYGRKDIGKGILHNHTDGGEGTVGIQMTEEHKRKIGQTSKGRVFSEESRKKKSDSLKKAYAEGRRVMTPEHKEKLKASAKNRKKIYNDGLTPQQRYVLRNKEKVKQRNREWARNNCGYNPDNYRL